MASLDDLSLALRQGAQSEAGLAGLNEQYAAANKLANTQTAQPDKFSRTSGLAVLNDVFGRAQGANQLRELEPQRAAARQSMADAKHALPLYQAGVNAAKVKQDQLNKENQAQALVQSALLANKNQIARDATGQANTVLNNETKQGYGVDNAATANEYKVTAAEVASADALKTMAAPKTYANPDGSGIVSVYNTPRGSVDIKGNPVDLGGKVPYVDPKSISARSRGGLTQSQLQTGLGKLRKEINPLYPVIQGVNKLNESLRALPNANESIDGIGLLEGGSGTFGNAARLVKDTFSSDGKAQSIHAAWTQTLAPLIREQAGLAQTRSELARVEETYGANWLNDEAVFREQYPEIMQAMTADLETIKGTFLPDVLDHYQGAMDANKTPTIFDAAQFSNPFATKEEQAAEAGVSGEKDLNSMSMEELEAELSK